MQDTCGKLDGRVWRFPGEEQHPAGLAGISEIRCAAKLGDKTGACTRGELVERRRAADLSRCFTPKMPIRNLHPAQPEDDMVHHVPPGAHPRWELPRLAAAFPPESTLGCMDGLRLPRNEIWGESKPIRRTRVVVGGKERWGTTTSEPGWGNGCRWYLSGLDGRTGRWKMDVDRVSPSRRTYQGAVSTLRNPWPFVPRRRTPCTTLVHAEGFFDTQMIN